MEVQFTKIGLPQALWPVVEQKLAQDQFDVLDTFQAVFSLVSINLLGTRFNDFVILV